MTDALQSGHGAAEPALAMEFTRSLADEITGLLMHAREFDQRLRPSATPQTYQLTATLADDPLNGLFTVLRGAEDASARLTHHLEHAKLLADRLLDP